MWARRSRTVRSRDRKSTRLNSSHVEISYAVFGLKKKSTLAAKAQTIGSTRAIIENVGPADGAYLQSITDALKSQFKGVIVLGGASNGFFFNVTATTEIYTLSLHDALPISTSCGWECVPSTQPETSSAVRSSRVPGARSEEHTSELQSRRELVCRLLLE